MTPISTTVQIKTLTPIWTGGVNKKMPRILETGILGSLRWWYEAVVRGLGGWACDPTKHTCALDAYKWKELEEQPLHERAWQSGLCDACRVFGATGWRRRFRLNVTMLNGTKRRDGYIGKFAIHLTPWENDASLDDILLTLKLIAQCGALGAKTKRGYGRIDIIEMPDFDPKATIEQWHIHPPPDNAQESRYPTFIHMFRRYRSANLSPQDLLLRLLTEGC